MTRRSMTTPSPAGKPPRWHDLPAGTPVQVELPRALWPESKQIDGRTVRVVLHGKLAGVPYQNSEGRWLVRLIGRPHRYPLESMRPQRGHTPHPPPKRAPTIPLAELEAKAREVIGDQFVRIEIKRRINRSELVTLCYGPVPEELRAKLTGRFKGKDYAHQLAVSQSRPGGDPDASRKAFLSFLQDLTVRARLAAGKLDGPMVAS